MEGKPQNRLQAVSADEIGCLIQAVALYCGISPIGSNTTTGENQQNSWSAGGDPLENPSGKEHADFALYMDTCRACPRKESKIWPKEFGCVVLIEVSSCRISGSTPFPIRLLFPHSYIGLFYFILYYNTFFGIFALWLTNFHQYSLRRCASFSGISSGTAVKKALKGTRCCRNSCSAQNCY